jgi:hypothetical protein
MRAHPPLAPSFWDAEPFREVSLGHPRRDPSLDQRHRQPPQGAQSPLSDPTRAQALIARELCAQLIALTRDRIPGRLDDPRSNVRAGVGRRARRKRLLEAPELRSRDPDTDVRWRSSRARHRNLSGHNTDVGLVG